MNDRLMRAAIILTLVSTSILILTYAYTLLFRY